MNTEERRTLEAKLRLLTVADRKKLYKKAAALRKANQSPTSRQRFAPDDEDGFDAPKMRPRSGVLDELVLKLLSAEAENPICTTESTGSEPIVIEVRRTFVLVAFPGRAGDLDRLPLAKELISSGGVAVGDRVHVREGVVTGAFQRKTKLSRPVPATPGREQLIVANVDVVGVVVSVNAPPLHPRIIDRYLVAIRHGGAQAILCVNKIDQLQDQEELEVLAPYRAIGVPIVLCSASTGEGLDDLRAALRGKLAAFVGHSGVGKSSLLNALRPDLNLEVGHLMSRWRRGAHTTTSSHLWEIGGGTCIIDTPGVREFGLWEVDRSELEESFPEFDGLQCRFRDCQHDHEPGCAVREAVASGQILPERLETYLRLREQIQP